MKYVIENIAQVSSLMDEYLGLTNAIEVYNSFSQIINYPNQDIRQKKSFGFIPIRKELINNVTFSSEGIMKSELIGVDFPIKINRENSLGNKVIAIVGIDPLRKLSDFQEMTDQHDVRIKISENLIVGTPYAFHSSFYREKRASIYAKFIDHILESGYDVYLTDIFKIWTKDGQLKDNDSFKKASYDLLKSELKIIDPNAIVCFGKQPTDIVRQIVADVEILDLPHPKARAKYWLNKFSEDSKMNSPKVASYENIHSYMMNKINVTMSRL
jgi:Uracil DNA glycosylase superfamily.